MNYVLYEIVKNSHIAPFISLVVCATTNYLSSQPEPTTRNPSPITTIPELETLIDSLDIRHTIKVWDEICKQYPKDTILESSIETSISGIREILLCLKALLEQVDRLSQRFHNTWVLSGYRIGNTSILAKDITTYNNKLYVRIKTLQSAQINHFQQQLPQSTQLKFPFDNSGAIELNPQNFIQPNKFLL